MLLAMMAQINPKETPDADRVYSLSFSDFGRLAGVNMHDNTYLEYLKDTVKVWRTVPSGAWTRPATATSTRSCPGCSAAPP